MARQVCRSCWCEGGPGCPTEACRGVLAEQGRTSSSRLRAGGPDTLPDAVQDPIGSLHAGAAVLTAGVAVWCWGAFLCNGMVHCGVL